MANSLKCDLCSKPATVHLTQIVNNKIHKVDLCEACAQAKGVTDPSGFSLADLNAHVAGSGIAAPPDTDVRTYLWLMRNVQRGSKLKQLRLRRDK